MHIIKIGMDGVNGNIMLDGLDHRALYIVFTIEFFSALQK
jgi:hypothetical protein